MEMCFDTYFFFFSKDYDIILSACLFPLPSSILHHHQLAVSGEDPAAHPHTLTHVAVLVLHVLHVLHHVLPGCGGQVGPHVILVVRQSDPQYELPLVQAGGCQAVLAGVVQPTVLLGRLRPPSLYHPPSLLSLQHLEPVRPPVHLHLSLQKPTTFPDITDSLQSL